MGLHYSPQSTCCHPWSQKKTARGSLGTILCEAPVLPSQQLFPLFLPNTRASGRFFSVSEHHKQPLTNPAMCWGQIPFSGPIPLWQEGA